MVSSWTAHNKFHSVVKMLCNGRRISYITVHWYDKLATIAIDIHIAIQSNTHPWLHNNFAYTQLGCLPRAIQ